VTGVPPERGRWHRLLREPLIHFFAAGALLFAAHRLIAGDPRTIAVTPGLRAELARRFRDHARRIPTSAELEAALRDWKRDEALYREALREGLDRDDATVRTALVDKVRARTAQTIPAATPTDADLQGWMAAHRELYASPLRYAIEWVAFPRSQPTAAPQRDRYRRALEGGADPRGLGRPIFGARLTTDELRERFGPGLAQDVSTSPRGAWRPGESGEDLLLVRVEGVEGGLPPLDEVRVRVTADHALAAREQAVERALQVIVDRYSFVERR
jgi:hypothetical protein